MQLGHRSDIACTCSFCEHRYSHCTCIFDVTQVTYILFSGDIIVSCLVQRIWRISWIWGIRTIFRKISSFIFWCRSLKKIVYTLNGWKAVKFDDCNEFFSFLMQYPDFFWVCKANSQIRRFEMNKCFWLPHIFFFVGIFFYIYS